MPAATSPKAKNYVPEDAILRIADTFTEWKEIERYSRVVLREEIAKNDYNVSPSRYIHTSEGEEFRPIAEIVEELEQIEAEAIVMARRFRELVVAVTAIS